MDGILFSAFVSSLAISVALIPVLTRWAGPLGLLDVPGERKVHAVPIVRVGGIAFATGAIVSVLIFAPIHRGVLAYLIGAVVILFFGVWDDHSHLNFKSKFLAQLAGVLIVVEFGGVRLGNIPFLMPLPWTQWLIAPLTVLILLGVTNAINLADGLDGLAGGLSLLSFAGIAYLAYLSGDPIVLILAFSVLGSVLGFLRFNTYPAQIFMGDAGSQFLGFSLGVSAVVLTDPARAPYSPVLALLIIGLPVLDTLLVMGQRLLEGRSPFMPDQNHVHHKLLSVGFFHHEAVILIYLLQTALIALAYVMRWQSDVNVFSVYLLVATGVVVFSFLAGQGWIHWSRSSRAHSVSLELAHRIRRSRLLTDLPVQILGIEVLLFLAVGAFVPNRVPRDFGFLAALLFGLLLAGFLLFRRAMAFLVRLSLYVGGTCLVYLSDQNAPGPGLHLHGAMNLFFGVMAALVVIAVQMNRERTFQITPLDYLIVLIAMVVPSLPQLQLGEISIGALVLKSIVLFFAFELLLNRLSHRVNHLGIAVLWTLLILGFRAWKL